MPNTALALSPHLDDAAFSCGGTLAELARAGWRVVVATVFTRSVPNPTGLALACQLDKGLGPEVDYMALRRDEDAAAMRALCAEPVWLPFAEAPHRGYAAAAELFASPRRDDAIGDAIAPAIQSVVDADAADLLLAPQAIGAHVDHLAVVAAVGQLRRRPPVLWWSDFPYVLRASGERDITVASLEVALDPRARARKRAACLAYASQIGFQFGGPEGLDAGLAATGGVERFMAEEDARRLLPACVAGEAGR